MNEKYESMLELQQEDEMAAVESLFKTRELSYYQEMMRNVSDDGKAVTVTLSADECAAILQAYDYGVTKITSDAAEYLDDAIRKIKEEIWT